MSTFVGMPNTTAGVTGAYPFEGSVELFQVSDDQRLPVHLSGDRKASLAVSSSDDGLSVIDEGLRIRRSYSWED